MTNTKRIVRADLDEIVEAVVKHIDESNLVLCRVDDPLDPESEFIPMSDPVAGSYIRTALERFVVDEELPDANLHRNELHYQLRRMGLDENYIEAHSQGFADGYNFLHDAIKHPTTPKKGGEDE